MNSEYTTSHLNMATVRNSTWEGGREGGREGGGDGEKKSQSGE